MKRLQHMLFRTIPGVVCLAAYLLSTPLAPLGTALLAVIDGEHHVKLVSGEQGASVVLAHDNSNLRRATSHHHCLAASALVLFAAPLSPGQPDHVLSFQSNVSTALSERLPVIGAASSSAALSAAALPLPACAPAPAVPVWRLEPPPDPTSVVVVRSTVFLI